MSETNTIDYKFFENEYTRLFKDLEENQSVLVSFFGLLNQENISKLEAEIERSLLDNFIGKSQLKKVFFISVETLQNMLIHGHRNSIGEQRNFFLLRKNSKSIEVISANLIANSAVSGLHSVIEKINSFDDAAALKQYYMDHLENNQISEKGGAGLGFITIAMKSGNKLKIDFKRIDDEFSMFRLTSTVSID